VKLKKYLKIAGGVLFGVAALAYLFRIPKIFAYAHNASDQDLNQAYSYVIVAFANIIIWGGLSLYLFWSAFKTKNKL
jgi:hypothetical protein